MTGDRAKPGDPTFRVLATVGAFEPGFRAGGPIKSVARIVDTASAGISVSLITRDRDLVSSDPYPGLSGRWITRGRSRVFYLATRRPQQWLRLVRDLREEPPFDLLYLNSVWQPIFSVIPVIAARLGLIRAKSILLAPRGEFSRGALTLKSRKKQLFLKAWRPFLRSMDVEWHASSEREASDIRTTFPDARVTVVSEQSVHPYESPLLVSEHDGPVRLVFIGRISPMKNLLLALEALHQLSSSAEFDIYGIAEDSDYWARCKSVIDHLPRHVRVTYHGELAPEEVREVFSRYDAFLFPTLGESYGHVIAESLSAACPVICSDETSWTDLLLSGGGMVVRDLTPAGLAAYLECVALMSPGERVAAKLSAGDVYLTWRRRQLDRNILDVVRQDRSLAQSP
jgi:glycosyltransferase involved in cell wall biosynthesis